MKREYSGLVDARASISILLAHGDVVGHRRAHLDAQVLIHLLLLAAAVGADKKDVNGHE